MNMKNTSAEGAVKLIQSGDRVFIHESAVTPITLLKGLIENSNHLRNSRNACHMQKNWKMKSSTGFEAFSFR